MSVFDILKTRTKASYINNIDVEIPHSVTPARGHKWGELIQNSIKQNDFSIKKLNSKNFLICHLPDMDVLIKPPSTKTNSGKGIKDFALNDIQRELAFYKASKAFGIPHLPKLEPIFLDGKPSLAIQYLEGWKTLDFVWRTSKVSTVRKFLRPFLKSGDLHKWAVMDYVLGNTDRHGNNILGNFETNKVVLIDHGGSLAGSNFDPSGDPNSYIPFYLRSWYNKKGFNELSDLDKIKAMPVNVHANPILNNWVIDSNLLFEVLREYDVDIAPFKKRLKQFQSIQNEKNVSLFVNALWL